MTSPLNYRGGRQFPQSILDDLDERLSALEKARTASPQPVAQPVEQINQCDGCRANAPLTERGIHRYSDGSLIGCTKDRYPVAQPVELGLIRKAREVTAEHNVETIRAYEPVAQPVEQTLATNEEIARTVHAVMSRIPGATFYNAAKEALDRAVQPVEQTRALTDAELSALIRKVADKLGIVWFVPDDSETYAWRTTNTNERDKFARAFAKAIKEAK